MSPRTTMYVSSYCVYIRVMYVSSYCVCSVWMYVSSYCVYVCMCPHIVCIYVCVLILRIYVSSCWMQHMLTYADILRRLLALLEKTFSRSLLALLIQKCIVSTTHLFLSNCYVCTLHPTIWVLVLLCVLMQMYVFSHCVYICMCPHTACIYVSSCKCMCPHTACTIYVILRATAGCRSTTCASVIWYADVCWRMLTYGRMTQHDVCLSNLVRVLKYVDDEQVKKALSLALSLTHSPSLPLSLSLSLSLSLPLSIWYGYADVCWRMQDTNKVLDYFSHEHFWRMLTYAADVCWRMLTYAGHQQSAGLLLLRALLRALLQVLGAGEPLVSATWGFSLVQWVQCSDTV